MDTLTWASHIAVKGSFENETENYLAKNPEYLKILAEIESQCSDLFQWTFKAFSLVMDKLVQRCTCLKKRLESVLRGSAQDITANLSSQNFGKQKYWS